MKETGGVEPPFEAEEWEQDEETTPIRRSFEYRDAEGLLICVADVEFSENQTEFGYLDGSDRALMNKGRELRGLVLRGRSAPGTKNTSVDLLALARRYGTRIIVADERIGSYFYIDNKNTAVVPPLRSPTDISTLLHELGHADQFREERFLRMKERYVAKVSAVENQAEAALSALTLAREFSAEAEELLYDPAIVMADSSVRDFMDSDDAYAEQVYRRDAMRHRLESGSTHEADSQEALQELESSVAEKLKLREEDRAKALIAVTRAAGGGIAIVDMIKLPAKVMERDATRRAFSWMREVRKRTGIDLFAEHETTTAGSGAEDASSAECRQSLLPPKSAERKEKTDARIFLKSALETYGADKPLGRTLKEAKKRLEKDASRIESVRRMIQGIGDPEIFNRESAAMNAEVDAADAGKEIFRQTGFDLEAPGFEGSWARIVLESKSLFDKDVRSKLREWKKYRAEISRNRR